MRPWRIVAGFAFVVVPALVACRKDTGHGAPPVASATTGGGGGLPGLPAGAASALASALATNAETGVTGNVRSAGGELGTWDIALDDCQSGEHDGFYGVDLYAPGSNKMRVRYVHDEAVGEVVKVAIPAKQGSALVFDRDAKCAVLEGNVQKQDVWTGRTKSTRIRHVQGHVKFDCTHTGGAGHVTGEATFTNCH